jgi:predicted MFS family arabinose efflux permease
VAVPLRVIQDETMAWNHSHVHIARCAAALAAAMGIGRFVYTPILPLMTAQAGLSPAAAGGLATANYVGYLVGALAGVVAPKLIRTTATWRVALVAVVASLALMPMTHDVVVWLVIRMVAGFASAVLFVIAVDWMLDHARGSSAQLPGWGFGGVGVGICRHKPLGSIHSPCSAMARRSLIPASSNAVTTSSMPSLKCAQLSR